ncbi:hypothetical protein EON77_17800, partial [bacterium]
MSRGGIAVGVALALLMGAGGALASNVDAPIRADGTTPLLMAAFEGDIDEAKRLIKAGADVRALNDYGV